MREVRTSGSVGASGGNSRGHPTRRRYPLHSPCTALYPPKHHGFPASVLRRRHALSAPNIAPSASSLAARLLTIANSVIGSFVTLPSVLAAGLS